MTMAAYYNEHDPFAAAWLRELIKAGVIANGEVDERDIQSVTPDDVRGFVQCHWFAGIGGWSYALRLAGWDDDRPVWTGSCPCQGYSAAGKQKGATDPRNLWPEWFRIIRECRPVAVFGEQVENASGHGWIDAVSTDLERETYTVGSLVLGAHSLSAPHRRQRIWFVADAQFIRCRGRGIGNRDHAENYRENATKRGDDRSTVTTYRPARLLADARSERRQQDTGSAFSDEKAHWGARRDWREPDCDHLVTGNGAVSDMGDADDEGSQGWIGRKLPERTGKFATWETSDTVFCRDGKTRPIGPGIFPLAHGVPARVGRLRGYGNAIVPQVAAEVIRAYDLICHGHDVLP
jgi:DNA (cytosine-5)-methyltransferase 1